MITCSIVTYKSAKSELSQVLECICNSSIDYIYIVDNSPTDEIGNLIAEYKNTIYIHGHGNVGYGSGHNIAIKMAILQNSVYHVIINPDIYFQANVFEKLREYMNANLKVGLVMPRVTYPDGELQYLCKLLPSPFDLFGRRFLPFKYYVEKRNYKLEMRASGYDKEIMVPFLSGCFMFFRLEALDKVNGFDDNFFMYCEDIDLCRRVSMLGYKTMYYPAVTIVHAHKKESFINKKMLKIHIKSAIMYFNKWGWFFDRYKMEINKIASSQY